MRIHEHINNRIILARYFVLISVLVAMAGCGTPVPSDPAFARIDRTNLPAPDLTADIPGLSNCTTSSKKTIQLNSSEPVIVIVHGCFGSAALFRSLAQVFAFHGQQAICFNYNDRDSLMQSSAELITALSLLSQQMNNQDITVIGHSQGGLIARKALIQEREDKLQANSTSLKLVTISSPYAGISAADHCASTTMRWLTLGLIVPICQIISGDKWYEITTPSLFIQEPGNLLKRVTSHIKIVTDERGSCRQYDEKGVCIEDDYVFSVDEQYLNQIDAELRVDNIEIAAGHSEIVGNYKVAPTKLIDLMQTKGIMRLTAPDRKENLSALLMRIYHYSR